MNVAWLTPAFASDCQGQIHSVFDRVVNASICLPDGMRLLALTTLRSPLLPDSIQVEKRVLDACEPDAAVKLLGDCLQIGDMHVPFMREAYPPLTPLTEQPRTAEFLMATAALNSGFAHMPKALCTRAACALTTPDAPRFIGLGLGLTPSYDDACVGVMATYRALGREAPFVLGSLRATTDVSARYLRMAQEGYYGQPLTQLLHAVFGQGDIQDALLRLLAVGATSGADMAYGVAAALKQTEKKENGRFHSDESMQRATCITGEEYGS